MANVNKKQQMIIDEIVRRAEMCREFMNDWVLFNQIINAYPTPGVNKGQLEKQFLTLKSKLAREHRVMKDSLQADYVLEVSPMNIVASATSLEAIHSQSEVAIKKLQGEWHHAFLSINEMLGVLEDKKRRAEAGERIFIPMPGMDKAMGGGGGGEGMSSSAKKNILLVIGVIIFVAVMLIVYMKMGWIPNVLPF